MDESFENSPNKGFYCNSGTRTRSFYGSKSISHPVQESMNDLQHISIRSFVYRDITFDDLKYERRGHLAVENRRLSNLNQQLSNENKV